MPRLAVIACTLTLLLISSASAWGQRPARPSRYESAYGPTLSPYLQLSRPPNGILNNYHNFVRPRVQLRSTLQRQKQQISRLKRNVSRNTRATSRVRSSGVAPTGAHSSYDNYSHYYPGS